MVSALSAFRNVNRRAAAIGLAVVTCAGITTFATESQAHAVTVIYSSSPCIARDPRGFDPDCEADLFINYNSSPDSGVKPAPGAVADMYGDVYDFSAGLDGNGQYVFVFSTLGSRPGAGQKIKNNAASADPCGVDSYRIYYNSGYTGHSQYFGSDRYCDGDFNFDSTLKNEDASEHWS
ncbi:hypothetical protein ACQEWB_37875 [Streptomyces sp. CA-249302]|uniref:hypothetical protein n=1 Tax=Streptomyces sp. CA-249302 TaxID=3240058 RepID=UPI003D8FDB86